jgi:hypothetical protein
VFCASAYGVIVSPESVTQSVHISVASIGGNEVAYYNITLADGSFTVVAVGLDVPLEITQLNQTLYQVNVASAVNTFRVNANGLVDSFVNSVDWNNRVKPEQVLAFNGSIYDHTIADQSVLSWNSAYNGNYEIGKGVSTSLLYGSPIITSMSPSNEILHSLNNIYWYEYPRDYQVDYYFNRTNVNDMDTVPEYVTTDFLRVEVALEGLRFPEPALETIILASPVNVSIGSSFAEYSVIKYLTYNYFGLRWNGEFKPSYFMSALVQNGVEVFYLVGTFFTYDGWTIRKVVMDSRGSLVSEIVPIAKAAGLKLVGVSSDAVYFWSDYDRVLYTYAGDYVLTPVKAITHFGKLKKSVFSQYDDILGLAFEGGFLLIRHGLESTYDIVVDELVDTKLGMAYRVGGGWYLFNPIDFSFPNQVDSILPVVLESEWLGGQNEFQVVTLKRIRVRGLSSSLITVQVAALDRIAKVDNEIQYQVQDSYGEVQVVPSTQTALAYKIVVSADDFVSAVEFEWDTVTGVAPRFNGGF